MSLNRREFLRLGGLSITSLFTGCTSNSVQNLVKKDENEKISFEKLKKSEYNIGKIEFNFFKKYFKLDNHKDVIKKIVNIQTRLGLKKDGILGPKTLKNIYINEYSLNLQNCSEEINKRWDIYLEMKEYYKHRSQKGDKPKLSHLDVFNHEFYYGIQELGYNIKGTNINEKLNGKIPYTISHKGPKIIIENYDGKTTLSYYENGILKVATYISPGRLNAKSMENQTFNNKGRTEKYYISSSEKRPGSIMPYGIGVKESEGIWIHGSEHDITGLPESGGCFRTPARYVKPLFEYINNLEKHNLEIEIKDIY